LQEYVMDGEESLDIEQAYQILELAPDADTQQIRAAYRSLARRFHPDVNDEPDAEGRMKRLNAAFALLTKRTTGVAEEPPPWDGERVGPWHAAHASATSYTRAWRPGDASAAPYTQKPEVYLGHDWLRWRLLAAVLALVLLLIGGPFLVGVVRAHLAALPLPRYAATPAATAVATGTLPALSTTPAATNKIVTFTPGQAFTLIGPGIGQLSLRDTALPIIPAGTVVASPPDAFLAADWKPVAWSPDGSEVAVTLAPAAVPNAPHEVEVATVPGGRVLALYQAQAAVWAPDSRHIALIVAQNPALPVTQTTYSVAIGDVTRPTQPISGALAQIASFPIWTPDSQNLIFAQQQQTQLWEYPISGHPRLLLTEPLGFRVEPVAWLDATTLLCMDRSNQRYMLTLVTPASGSEQPLSAPDTVAPRAVVANAGQDVIYRFAANQGQGVQLLDYSLARRDATTLIPSGYAPDSPSLSSDGALLAFTAASNSAAARPLCLSPAGSVAGAAPACMTPSVGAIYVPAWSPAQRQILYVLANQGDTTLHVLTVTSG
jgi:hypothetical protein